MSVPLISQGQSAPLVRQALSSPLISQAPPSSAAVPPLGIGTPVTEIAPPALEFLDLVATPIKYPDNSHRVESVSLGEDDSIWLCTQSTTLLSDRKIFRKLSSRDIDKWEQVSNSPPTPSGNAVKVDASNFNTAIIRTFAGDCAIYEGGANPWRTIPGPGGIDNISIGSDGYILASTANMDLFNLSPKGNNFYKIETVPNRHFSVGDLNNVWTVSASGFTGSIDFYPKRLIIEGTKGNKSQPLRIGEGKTAGEVGANVAANLVGVSRGGARVVVAGIDQNLYTLTSNWRWKHISEIPPARSKISALSVNRNAFIVLEFDGTMTQYTPRAAAAAAAAATAIAIKPAPFGASPVLAPPPAPAAASGGNTLKTFTKKSYVLRTFNKPSPSYPCPTDFVDNGPICLQRCPAGSEQISKDGVNTCSEMCPAEYNDLGTTCREMTCAELVVKVNKLMRDYIILKDRFKDVDKTISGARVQTLLAGGSRRKKKYSVSRKQKARSSRKRRNSGNKSRRRR